MKLTMVWKCRYCGELVKKDTDPQVGVPIHERTEWHTDCMPGATGIMDPIAVEVEEDK